MKTRPLTKKFWMDVDLDGWSCVLEAGYSEGAVPVEFAAAAVVGTSLLPHASCMNYLEMGWDIFCWQGAEGGFCRAVGIQLD